MDATGAAWELVLAALCTKKRACDGIDASEVAEKERIGMLLRFARLANSSASGDVYGEMTMA